MINYNNQPCPGCGKHMHEGDDIVVCPVCATPQHRECWMSEGHCVNESLHSPDFVWQPREKVTLDEPVESSKHCHVCGAENSSDALHCANCGALLSENATENNNCEEIECKFCGERNPSSNRICSKCGAPLIFENNFFQSNIYMNGVDSPEDEPLGNTTIGNAAFYIQNSSKRYIPKFQKISSGNKISFNWAAFLFGQWWFFFRKLFKTGIILVLLFLSVTLLTYNYQSQIYSASVDMENQLSEIQEQYGDSTNDEALMNEEIEKESELLSKFLNETKKPAIIIAVIALFEHLICGFIANPIYYKRMNLVMEKLNETEAPEEVKKSLLIRAGGISFIGVAAGLLGSELLTSAISYISSYLTGTI